MGIKQSQFACLVGLAVPLEVYGEGLHGADCLPHVLRGIDGGLGFCGRRRQGRGEERWVAEGFTATRVCASDEATSAVLTSLVAIDDISGNVFRTSVQRERGSEEATEFRPSWKTEDKCASRWAA
jgi:hypothetical protein